MILKDKVAIITGSGRGLGKAIALALAKEGAKLVLMSRTEKELRSVVKEMGLPESRAAILAGDISKESDAKRISELALSRFGTVDILVNNAGVIGPIAPIKEVKPGDWVNNINVNIIGTFLCTRMVLPVMIGKRHGKIINIAGSGERPLPNFSAYASSKSAVIRFTETLAQEVEEYGIEVNAVAPGGISTKMTEEIFESVKPLDKNDAEKYGKVLKSGGVPLEVPASLVVFLASEESNGVSGKILSAVHDDWKNFGRKKGELKGTDMYTMRRISPDLLERLRLKKEVK